MVAVLIVPLVTALTCYTLGALRAVYAASVAGSAVLAAVAAGPIAASFGAPLSGLGGVFFMDSLSGYIMALVISLPSPPRSIRRGTWSTNSGRGS